MKGFDIADLIYEWLNDHRIHPDDFHMMFAHEMVEKMEQDKK